MEKIIVTGGAGYKGVKLVKKLLEKGYTVTIVDNFMYGYDSVLHLVQYKNLNIVNLDIRNSIPGLHEYDVVLHLAGISGYPACEANPHSADRINVEATKKLIKQLSPEQFLINASTTSFYGKTGQECNEQSPIDPVSMYGVTKFRAEEIVSEHANSVSLRFATVFGPSPKMRMDLMVNDFTYRAVKEGMVVLFDSYAKRTFIHVDDAVDSYVFTLEKWDKMKGQVFNVGNDSLNYSKLEIAKLVSKYVDYKIIDSDIKDRDVRHFIINFNKIKSLGFVPQNTVEDGIRELVRMYQFYTYFSHFKTI